MKKLTRRRFITNSTAGTIGAAAGLSMISGFNANASPDSKGKKEMFSFSRKIPVGDDFDIVVAGGGPAGSAAAICAARLGAKVLLVEATGCLGGMGTSGLVCAFGPVANGERMLASGFLKQLLDTMYKRGFLGIGEKPEIYQKAFHRWTKYQPEGLKLLLDEFAIEAGVEIRFFTRVVEADVDSQSKQVKGIIIHNIEGFQYITAKKFIDCTGDAVLADICGVECREAFRDTPDSQPTSLMSLITNIDFAKSKPVEKEMMNVALKEGHFTQFDRHFPGMSQINNHIGYLNGGHVFNLDALRCRSLSDGVILGRKIAQEFISFYKKYVPGGENIEQVTTASLMGIRETRRIVGEYELTVDDFVARRQFPDQIGTNNRFCDIHPKDTSDEEWDRFNNVNYVKYLLKPGEFFGLPYSMLVPVGWRNLWVAGRCISCDTVVHGSIRSQTAASIMGQAAGTAAVQSLQTEQPANDLDTEQLIKTLRQEGVYLPQKSLSKKMTRGS